jgi:hypothetical protein
VGVLDDIAKVFPEAVRLNLAGDVEAPPIDPKLDPVPGHVKKKVAHRGVVGVELRQGGNVVPRRVVVGPVGGVGAQGPVLDLEPVDVGRVGPFSRT